MSDKLRERLAKKACEAGCPVYALHGICTQAYCPTKGEVDRVNAILADLPAQGLAIVPRRLLEDLEPYLDAIVCYASTMDEHPPNKTVREIRDIVLPLKAAEPKDSEK